MLKELLSAAGVLLQEAQDMTMCIGLRGHLEASSSPIPGLHSRIHWPSRSWWWPLSEDSQV